MLFRLISVCIIQIISNFIGANEILGSILSFAGNPVWLSVPGVHLLINMQVAGERSLNQGTGCSSKLTISNIDFAALLLPAAVSESENEVTLSEFSGVEEIC